MNRLVMTGWQRLRLARAHYPPDGFLQSERETWERMRATREAAQLLTCSGLSAGQFPL